MAITNAQQYKQLVNPPMKGNKRPGYRGEGAYQGGATNQGGAGSPSGNGDGVERNTGLERARQRNIETSKTFKEKKPEVKIPNFGLTGMFLNLFNKGVNSPIQKFADFTASKNRPFFIDEVVRAGKIPGLNFGTVSKMTEEELEEAYQNYDNARLSGDIDAYGNPLNQGGGEGSNILLPQGIMAQAPSIMDQEPEIEEDEGLSRRFRADGGIMNTDVVGGEIDFDSARQMYGLGKLVKKVTRSVKKIAKSPIGKAAIGYALTGGLSNLAAGQSFGTNFFSPTSFISKGGIKNIFTKGGLQNIGSKLGFGNIVGTSDGGTLFQKNLLGKIATSPTGIIAGTSLIAGALTAEQEEEAQLISDETGIDIAEIRANPNKYLARRFRAEGGSMDEPVAKKTMPLLDMGGKEMDLRAEGGFVPIGRMEKADDVPARLSKNEFVFTADAVRNAGEGDVDKGAEVMYNMMKNLESGGDVSEESQGLEGARKMFQTSQRLEEVL